MDNDRVLVDPRIGRGYQRAGGFDDTVRNDAPAAPDPAEKAALIVQNF